MEKKQRKLINIMQLTKNFNLNEFNCKDGSKVPSKYIENVKELSENLQIIRDYINEPIHINSGYRSPIYNKKVGGVSNSQHLYAKAADITSKNYTPKKLYKILLKLISENKIHNGGIGVYDGFIHYDIRKNKARWGKV